MKIAKLESSSSLPSFLVDHSWNDKLLNVHSYVSQSYSTSDATISRGNRREGENNRQVSKVVGQNYATNIGRCLIDLETLQIASSSHLVSERSARDEMSVAKRGVIDQFLRLIRLIEIRAQKRRSDSSDVKRDFFVPYLKKKKMEKPVRRSQARGRISSSLSLSLCLAVHRIELYTDLLSEEFLCFDSYIKINWN